RFAWAPDRSVPSTFALSIRYLVWLSVSQATAWTPGSTIEPVGRLFSMSQVICGTLNCTVAGRSATSSGVSVRNDSSLLMVAWSTGFGSVIPVAVFAASAPILLKMACWRSARLGPVAPGDALPVGAAAAGDGLVVAGGVVAAGVGDGLGDPVAPGDGLALPD